MGKGTLRATIRLEGGTGYVGLYFTAEYDKEKNQTTVTLLDIGYDAGTITPNLKSIYASISVRASDNTESYGTATSNGSTPSPSVITVQHNPDAGFKSVTVAMYVKAYYQAIASGSTTSKTYTVGTRQGIGYIDTGSAVEQYSSYIEDGTAYNLYAPYIDTGSGWVAN